MASLKNDIKVGDIVLPEMISEDRKLVFKQIVIPQDLELNNCPAFTNAIKRIISGNGDFMKQFSNIWNEENSEDYFCCVYKNECNFLCLIEQALFIRIIETDINTKMNYNCFNDCINEEIAQLLTYDGSEVTIEELKIIFEYLMALQVIKYNLVNNESLNPTTKNKIKELNNAGLPKGGLLSWLFNFIRTKK